MRHLSAQCIVPKEDVVDPTDGGYMTSRSNDDDVEDLKFLRAVLKFAFHCG